MTEINCMDLMSTRQTELPDAKAKRVEEDVMSIAPALLRPGGPGSIDENVFANGGVRVAIDDGRKKMEEE